MKRENTKIYWKQRGVGGKSNPSFLIHSVVISSCAPLCSFVVSIEAGISLLLSYRPILTLRDDW